MRYLSIILAMALFLTASLHAETRVITVAGFINTGKAGQDVNAMISRSLITFLSRVPGVSVTPWADAERAAGELKYWAGAAVDPDTAVGIGLKFGAKQVITGDYRVDEARNLVTVNVLVFDTLTGEPRLKRSYSGPAGMDLFDTIDRMVRNVSFLLLGKNVKTGRILLSTESPRTYRVYVNGVYQRDLDRKKTYDDAIIAEENVELSVRLALPEGEREVYRNLMFTKENATNRLVYQPSSGARIRAVNAPGSQVFLNGQDIGKADSEGNFIIYNLAVDTEHTLRLVLNGELYTEKIFRVTEGENPVLVIGSFERPFYFPVKIITGGIGLSAGLDFFITLDFRLAGAIGLVNIPLTGTWQWLGEAGAGWCFARAGSFSFWAWGGIHTYFDPFIVSPYIRLEAEWKGIFLEIGTRYSLAINPADWTERINPILALGYRF